MGLSWPDDPGDIAWRTERHVFLRLQLELYPKPQRPDKTSFLAQLAGGDRLLKHGDLSSVVQAVLHDAVKKVVEVVLATRNNLVQALVLKFRDRLGKLVGGLEEAILRALPLPPGCGRLRSASPFPCRKAWGGAHPEVPRVRHAPTVQYAGPIPRSSGPRAGGERWLARQ